MNANMRISQVLWIVVLVGVGLAALANPTPAWGGVVVLLRQGLFCTAIVGIIYRSGGDRAFWVGFSIFGWGLLLLCSEFLTEIRNPGGRAPSGPIMSSSVSDDDPPIRSLIKTVVGYLPNPRRDRPKSVGQKILVQWGNAAIYFPSSVIAIGKETYQIRYDTDPAGTFDEWVSMDRIRLDANSENFLIRSFRIGEVLFTILFALAGGIIARWFHATRKPKPTPAS